MGPVYESRTILGVEVESRAIKMPDRHIRSLNALKTISMGSSADAAPAANAVALAELRWPVNVPRCRSRLWFVAGLPLHCPWQVQGQSCA